MGPVVDVSAPLVLPVLPALDVCDPEDGPLVVESLPPDSEAEPPLPADVPCVLRVSAVELVSDSSPPVPAVAALSRVEDPESPHPVVDSTRASAGRTNIFMTRLYQESGDRSGIRVKTQAIDARHAIGTRLAHIARQHARRRAIGQYIGTPYRRGSGRGGAKPSHSSSPPSVMLTLAFSSDDELKRLMKPVASDDPIQLHRVLSI